MLTFYAFVGKLHTFFKAVAAGIHRCFMGIRDARPYVTDRTPIFNEAKRPGW
jgi:hypothetical protein